MMNILNNILPISAQFMILSAFAFAIMSVCVKLVNFYGIPVLEIVAARALVSLILSYLDIRRKKISVWGNNKPLLLARGCVGALALMCVFFSVSTLPLAEATIIQYLHPVFTAILSLFILKEHVQRSTFICIVLCILGLLIMLQPNLVAGHSTELPWFSIYVALLGSFGSATAYIIVKKLSATEYSSVIVLYFPLIALPLSILLLGKDFVMPDLEELFLLILVGIFTQVGQIGLTKAMKTEMASKATAYSYVQIVFSMIWGWIVFSEIPSIWTTLGGILIVGGAMVNVMGRR